MAGEKLQTLENPWPGRTARNLIKFLLGEDPRVLELETINTALETENRMLLAENATLQQQKSELLAEVGRIGERVAALEEQNSNLRREFSYFEKTISQLLHDTINQVGNGVYMLRVLEDIGDRQDHALEFAESHEGQMHIKKSKNGLILAIDLLKSFKKRMAIVKGDFELKENDFDLMQTLKSIKSALWQPTCELEISLRKLGEEKFTDSSAVDSFEVKGDCGVLIAALFNLVKNAIEAAKSSETTNKAVILQIDEGLDSIGITIKNPGAIPKEIQNRILKESVTHGKPNGNGLGMLIAKSFIEALGGKISVESKENTTIVNIELPKNPMAVLAKRKKQTKEAALTNLP
ncbi:MAG: sensor histidine kinase [Candidatus Gracilibacteria bacterium]|nr:sensor histidine kinase [Candidatus Gracilibacteria bacterium]MDD5178820.1 sensor histidine kinase [Candidatus Gracilibacteria bacterium]